MTLGVIFFALYDTLVHYMTYKDAIAPSTIYAKIKEILLYYVEYWMVLSFLSLVGATSICLAHANAYVN
jgi:hypothetical protein